MLEACLYHHCLDVVLAPLKAAAQLGVMLLDLLKNIYWCFMPLASFIIDTPEAQLISCVGRNTLPVTMANYTQFGDSF
jgi:Plavaka transposase